MTKRKAPKTHFKQVPVKIALKVAKIDSPDPEPPGAAAVIKRRAKQ